MVGLGGASSIVIRIPLRLTSNRIVPGISEEEITLLVDSGPNIIGFSFIPLVKNSENNKPLLKLNHWR